MCSPYSITGPGVHEPVLKNRYAALAADAEPARVGAEGHASVAERKLRHNLAGRDVPHLHLPAIGQLAPAATAGPSAVRADRQIETPPCGMSNVRRHG